MPGSGAIRTRTGFGDVQLHIEWASPDPPQETGQDRGNSGVFLMGRYEVQVLDSYRSDTYADGQYPPRFNASRPPCEWQTYDIYFRRPRFGADGARRRPGHRTIEPREPEGSGTSSTGPRAPPRTGARSSFSRPSTSSRLSPA
ncbi:MAG: DUF1080 domain-containing protein [Gemmatimonadota bacterium]|nr:DUF1080 domain-containing protein [Gemmatimonadota bacterium]